MLFLVICLFHVDRGVLAWFLKTVRLPERFDGTRGPAAQAFLNQVQNNFCAWYPFTPTPQRKRPRRKQALQTIRQTSSIMAYTQQFNFQAYKSGWDNTVLISLYWNGLKANIQIVQLSDLEALIKQVATKDNQLKADS
ncbi:hypothetical protein VP01_7619g1, partial [Puccinia sorghi]